MRGKSIAFTCFLVLGMLIPLFIDGFLHTIHHTFAKFVLEYFFRFVPQIIGWLTILFSMCYFMLAKDAKDNKDTNTENQEGKNER